MQFSNFSDGLWVPDSGMDFAVPPGALVQADNVEFQPDGSVRGRRGNLKYNASAESGAIKGMWRHYPRSGTAKLLVATDVGSTVSLRVGDDGAGTFANVTSGTGLTDAYHYFANWPAKNKTFICNGTDEMKEYDGSTLATTASGTAKKGPYLTVHKSRLWATDPSELNYSVYASDINDEDTWSASSHLSCNDPWGGRITGLASFLDSLLILKSTCVFRFVGDIGTTIGAQLAMYTNKGCIAPNTVSVAPFGVFYLGMDGLYLTDGVNPIPTEVSTPIRTLFRSRSANTTYPNAVGVWDPYRMRYVLTLDPTDSSSTYVCQRLQLITEKNLLTGERSRVAWAWSKMTGIAANAMCVWGGHGDSGQLLIGDQSGSVRYTDTGTQDDGSAITSTIKTQARLFDSKTFRSARVYKVMCKFRSTAALSGALYYDHSSSSDTTFSLGDVTGSPESKEGYSAYITDFADQGRFIQVSLSSTESYNWDLSWIKLDARFRGHRVRRNTN